MDALAAHGEAQNCGCFALTLPDGRALWARPDRSCRSSLPCCAFFSWTATDRYIARLIAVPLIGTLILSAMLLVLEKMVRLFDFVATEGGPVSVVFRMLANLIPGISVARHSRSA